MCWLWGLHVRVEGIKVPAGFLQPHSFYGRYLGPKGVPMVPTSGTKYMLYSYMDL